MVESSAQQPTWRIERLAKHHNRRTFMSGQQLLDDFMRARAGQYDRRDLGRLAVDESMRGQGLGGDLLFHALQTAAHSSQAIGVYAVDVFAIDEDAKSFYQKFGFQPLNDDPFHLFLPIKLIRQLMPGA